MIELIVFLLAFGADQALKFWTKSVLLVPGASRPLWGNFLELYYAQNFGTPDQVSFIRGRSTFMNIIRILEVLVILYLLIVKRKKIARITRIGLAIFLAGLIGNQFDYIFFGFVTDMLLIPMWSRSPVFNLADIFVIIGMVILLIRVAFFEGQDLVNKFFEKREKKKDDKTDAG